MSPPVTQYLNLISLGDEQAFRRLVCFFADRLYQFALSLVKSPQDAEEIVSDVFLKVWQLRKQLPADANEFLYYLYKAVKNTSLNYLKKKNRKKEIETTFCVINAVKEAGQSPEEMIICKENLAHIQHAVNSLPSRCRQIFLMVKEDNLSYQQVAALLDISPATVNVQITIAIKKIWKTLSLSLQETRP